MDMRDIGYFFLLYLQAQAQRSSQFLLHFLKAIITAIVCLTPIIDSHHIINTAEFLSDS